MALFWEWNRLFLAVKQLVLGLKQVVSDCVETCGTTCFAIHGLMKRWLSVRMSDGS